MEEIMNFIKNITFLALVMPGACFAVQTKFTVNINDGKDIVKPGNSIKPEAIKKQRKTGKKLSVTFSDTNSSKSYNPLAAPEIATNEEQLKDENLPTRQELILEKIKELVTLAEDENTEQKHEIYYNLSRLFTKVNQPKNALLAYVKTAVTCERKERLPHLYFKIAKLQDIEGLETFVPNVKARIKLYQQVVDLDIDDKCIYSDKALDRIEELELMLEPSSEEENSSEDDWIESDITKIFSNSK